MIGKILFWILTGLVFYTYFGYTCILLIINLFKKRKSDNDQTVPTEDLQAITLIIPAYNERDYIASRMENIESLDYPKDKLELIWITDGSDDGSPEIIRKYKNVKVLHKDTREGKSWAINRAMREVKNPIVVLSDANALLNTEALLKISGGFNDPEVGCIAGEKRITNNKHGNAANAGEGSYWRYESFIKRLESGIGSTIGGAGELIAFRTSLFEEIPADIINDDLSISLAIIKKGYRLKYCPEAYAVEKSSLNIREEAKRKTRISIGGMQILSRYFNILNVFRYGFYSFQFLSHKVLRWTIVPLSIIPIFFINALLLITLDPPPSIYYYTFFIQILFYVLVLAGSILKNINIRIKIIFLPYYLFIINHSAIIGILKFIKKDYSTMWDKARRMA